MPTEVACEYTPSWLLIGDADDVRLALAYGIVAILTVWQIENVVERLLFRQAQPVTLRDMAALVCFKSSTWIEVLGWAVWRPKRTKLSRRALHGIFLRLFITLIDVLIVLAAIPLENDVYESNVGSTELSFAANSTKLQLNMSESVVFSPCVSDNIHYKSFSATARRQICYSSSPRFEIRDVGVSKQLQNTSIGNDIFLIMIDRRTQQLNVISIRSKFRFAINHVVVYADESKTESNGESVESSLQLKLPADIVEQAAHLVKRHPRLNKPCSQIDRVAARITEPLGNVAIFRCSPAGRKHTLTEPDMFPRFLFQEAGTVKVENSTKLRMVRSTKNGRFRGRHIEPFVGKLRVGYVVRPKVCIYPALIFLGFVSILALLAIYIWPGANVSLSLWSWCSTASGSPNSWNPLRTDEQHDRAASSMDSVSELIARA